MNTTTYLALKDYGEHWKKGEIVGMSKKYADELVKKKMIKNLTKEEYNQLIKKQNDKL